MTLLSELDLDDKLIRAAVAAGFEEPTEVQAQAIPAALSGKDLMVSASTGSGKTAAFLLPMLQRFQQNPIRNSSTRGLILSPTRELALQTQKRFEELAKYTYIKSGLIIGGEPTKFQIATLRRNPEVIIATPGRLVQHIEQGIADLSDVEMLVLDEADSMLTLGFSDDMSTIARRCAVTRQNLLFSATLKHKGMEAISGIFTDPLRIKVGSPRDGNSTIVQQRILVDDDKHKQAVLLGLLEEELAEKVFVFCNTRVQCQQLGQFLNAKNIKAGFIHGEVSQSARKQVLNQFRDNKLQVLVATDVAARGLDVDDVDLVVNFTVAHSGDEHLHRVGRTGRMGKAGKAVTLVTEHEWNLMASIERYLKIDLGYRAIKGLKAKYTGPKKLKSSGKAAGKKKKKQRKR